MAAGRWLFVVLPCAVVAFAVAFLRSSTAARLNIAISLFGWKGVVEVAREGFAQRLVGQKATASRTEWFALLDALAEADYKWLGPSKAIYKPDDIAEGHQALGDYLRTGWEWFVDVDPSRPVLRQAVTADRKALGDNPDSFYYTTNLDPSLAYLVRGRMTGEAYFSLAIHSVPCRGCFQRDPAIADIHDGKISFGTDQTFEILISATKPAGYIGNWLSVKDANGEPLQMLARHYYERELSVLADPHFVRPPLTISLADPESAAPLVSPPAPRPTDEQVAQKLRAVKMFVQKHTTELERDAGKIPKWFSFQPHVFGDPNDDGQSGGAGAIDIAYSAAPFKLAPDEALVIDGIMPECKFANIMLWNRFLQSFDYITHRTSLNRKQLKAVGEDGYYRIVLAHSDPGVPNWLDTMGRDSGTMFWRFLLPKFPVVRPNATVVKFADIR